MALMAESPRRAGRPRNTDIDERALGATRELLVERGFEATTIQAVAARSGVHASAIYRRWPSRIELIEDAAFPDTSPLALAPTGDLRRDLRRFVRAYVSIYGAPTARAASAGLLAHHQAARHEGSDAAPHTMDLRMSARPQFREILSAAGAGSVDPALNPDEVFDMLIGAIWMRIRATGAKTGRQPFERIVDMIVRLLRPLDD